MKMDKNQKKEWLSTIHSIAKLKGYKLKSNSFFKKINNTFIHCDFLIVDAQKLVYRIYIKEYDYDIIFWNILQMSDNIKEPDSLRACGAFKSPSILLNEGEIAFTQQYNEIANHLILLVDKYSKDFINQYDIDEYVVKYETGCYKEVLKCLAYIHMGQKSEALKISQSAINSGKKSGYSNEGKDFFSWLIFLAQHEQLDVIQK